MSIDQLAIMFTGVLAAWINQDRRERVRRWACVIGLAGQPFWLYAGWKAQQWGALIVSAGFTVAYLRGVAGMWLQASNRRELKKHPDCPAFCKVCESDPTMPFACARNPKGDRGG